MRPSSTNGMGDRRQGTEGERGDVTLLLNFDLRKVAWFFFGPGLWSGLLYRMALACEVLVKWRLLSASWLLF